MAPHIEYLGPISRKSRNYFESISGATVPFISPPRRGSKPSNFLALTTH